MSVDITHRLIHTPPNIVGEWKPVASSRDSVTTIELRPGSARAELLSEQVDEVRTRARRFVQEPAEDTWRDLVVALTRALGDSEAYDLLRAAEIHHRLRGRI